MRKSIFNTTNLNFLLNIIGKQNQWKIRFDTVLKWKWPVIDKKDVWSKNLSTVDII